MGEGEVCIVCIAVRLLVCRGHHGVVQLGPCQSLRQPNKSREAAHVPALLILPGQTPKASRRNDKREKHQPRKSLLPLCLGLFLLRPNDKGINQSVVRHPLLIFICNITHNGTIGYCLKQFRLLTLPAKDPIPACSLCRGGI